jgi:adenylyltransferase/sulfurtransferase
VGAAGQARLYDAKVLVVGLGATGGAIAGSLARAGVALTLVDRDHVERHNLQRQSLFCDADVDAGLPKAEAARRHLSAVDPALSIRAEVADLHAGNVLRLARGHDLIIDGTDNFAARYIINDAALTLGIPWVYCAAVGAHGAVMPIAASGKPCLRCLHPDPPPPGSHETCDTSGVLQPAVAVIAGLAAMEAIKILLGQAIESPGLRYVEVWDLGLQIFAVPARPGCAGCDRREMPALAVDATGDAIASLLCGRDAVHVRPAETELDLALLARRLRGAAEIELQNPYILRFVVDGLETTVFADGRAIVKGSDDPARARGHYARWIGL